MTRILNSAQRMERMIGDRLDLASVRLGAAATSEPPHERIPLRAGSRPRHCAQPHAEFAVQKLTSDALLEAGAGEQQHLVEQLESSNEEMKAANEEILSMNEELQCTNEELTTSKEELQSMNEELTTLNAQLQDKVHELTAVNDDLANLLVSTVTVFLDTDLRIKRLTTAASHVLNLQKSDTGRPMIHIA